MIEFLWLFMILVVSVNAVLIGALVAAYISKEEEE
jgi:hypothetical protein